MLREQKNLTEKKTTIVLSVTQKTVFKEDGAQMGIPHDTIKQLNNEGISVVADLIDFNKYTIKHISANIHRPAGRIPDPNQELRLDR